MVNIDAVIWHVYRYIFPATFALLPGQMDSPTARAMLLAIALQESAGFARQQGGTKIREGEGPAKGLWQFERKGGCAEVLEADLRPFVLSVCENLGYPAPTFNSLHEAIEHNDVLACALARLLLWKDPRLMPDSTQPGKGWQIYLDRWRPGKPHPDKWPANFARAWEIIRA